VQYLLGDITTCLQAARGRMSEDHCGSLKYQLEHSFSDHRSA